jgi:adenylate cyclase
MEEHRIMAKNQSDRRLSAVLIADIAEYTKLVESDTEGTVSAWKSARKDIIDSTIRQLDGRIVKYTGDGFLAEFPTVQNAVDCAIRMQLSLKKSPLNFRMAINLGDIIDDGRDIHGEGVNIAARIEALAEPGGITISGSVFEQVRNRIRANFEDLGEHDVKHVSAPVRVFKIASETSKNIENKTNKSAISAVEKTNLHTDTNNRKTRLLVLPFRNSGKDQDNKDLVDGIVEDLITEFSLINDIEIMSNASTQSLRDKEINLNDIRDKFGVDFFLTGSIRSSGKRVRISVELLSVDEGSVLWNEKYDRVLEDVFDVQDEIVKNVIFSLIGEIEIKTLERSERKPTSNLSSYEYLLKGKVLHHNYTKDTHPKALEYFNKSIEMDPNNSAAYAWKACTIGGGISRGFFEESEDISKAIVGDLIEKSLEINNNNFECFRMLCRVHLTIYNDHDKSIEFGRKAYALNPNDPRILWGLGVALSLSGNGEEALEYLLKSFELSPHIGVEGSVDHIASAILLAYYSIDDYKNVLVWFYKLSTKGFRDYSLYFSSLKNLNEEFIGIEDFREKYSDVELKREVELFRFKDEKHLNQLIPILDDILG